jgi:hypothetical protein
LLGRLGARVAEPGLHRVDVGSEVVDRVGWRWCINSRPKVSHLATLGVDGPRSGHEIESAPEVQGEVPSEQLGRVRPRTRAARRHHSVDLGGEEAKLPTTPRSLVVASTSIWRCISFQPRNQFISSSTARVCRLLAKASGWQPSMEDAAGVDGRSFIWASIALVSSSLGL